MTTGTASLISTKKKIDSVVGVDLLSCDFMVFNRLPKKSFIVCRLFYIFRPPGLAIHANTKEIAHRKSHA